MVLVEQRWNAARMARGPGVAEARYGWVSAEDSQPLPIAEDSSFASDDMIKISFVMPSKQPEHQSRPRLGTMAHQWRPEDGLDEIATVALTPAHETSCDFGPGW
jgi:hypothetical protein